MGYISNPRRGITPTGTKQITQNGTHDVLVQLDVNVQPNLQSKTVTPGVSQQTVSPDSGYDGLSQVTVSGDADLVAGNIKKDVEIFGVTGSYEGGSAVQRLTLLSEEVSAKARNSYSDGDLARHFAACVSRNQGGNTSYSHYVESDNSVKRVGYFTGGIGFLTKIPHGLYNKLYIQLKTTQYGTGWRQVWVRLCNTPQLATGGDTAGTTYKMFYISSQDRTAAQINEQAGITINVSSQYECPKQTIEINISDMTNDCYLMIFNCDMNLWLYNIYLE